MSSGGTLRRQAVSITGLLVADGLGTVLPVVLLLVLMGTGVTWSASRANSPVGQHRQVNDDPDQPGR